MITQNRKAVSAVIATIMLLMITVSLVGVFYVFSSTLATQSTSSSSEQASQLTAQLSMCMQIDNIIGNQVILRNCGKGVIENKSLVVTMDDVALGASTQTIAEGNSSAVNISGLWQVPFGKHSLKITNGAAVAQSLVEIIPNPDGLAGSWDFDEDSGTKAYDNSGNGNAGTLVNMNTTGNSTSGWTDGKFGSGLLFDGTNDYISISTISSTARTQEGWFYLSQTASAKGSLNYLFDNFYQHNANNFLYFTGTSDYFNAGFTTVNKWYHLALVFTNKFDTSSAILYVNGVPKTLNQQTGPHAINPVTTVGTSSASFNGTIDEVRIWSKAFSPDETAVLKRII